MPRAASQYISEIRRRLRDASPLASNPIWSRQEVLDAVIDAQRDAQDKFWTEEVYTSIQLIPAVHQYPLPGTVKQIQRIERQYIPFPGVFWTNSITWQTLRDWRISPGVETNFLWVQGNWPLSQINIYFETDVPVFPYEDTLFTSVSTTGGVIPWLASNVNIGTWPSPGFLQIGQEIMHYDSVTATSFTSVTRGMFGTGQATATMAFGLQMNSETIISPVWPGAEPRYEGYVTAKAMEFLLLQRLLNADSQGERNIATLAAEWNKRAEEQRARFGLRRPSRSLRVARGMR